MLSEDCDDPEGRLVSIVVSTFEPVSPVLLVSARSRREGKVDKVPSFPCTMVGRCSERLTISV